MPRLTSQGSGSSPTPLHADADRITRQLVGVPATAGEQDLYAAAVARLGLPFEPWSQRLWNIMMRRRPAFKPIDGGLALLDPRGPIRQRVFIMLAILEASPRHAVLFLPRTQGVASPLVLPVRLGLAGLRAALGVPIVLLVRWGTR